MRRRVTLPRLLQQNEGIQCHQIAAKTASFHQAAIFLHAVILVNTTRCSKTRTIRKVKQRIQEKAQQIHETQEKDPAYQWTQ